MFDVKVSVTPVDVVYTENGFSLTTNGVVNSFDLHDTQVDAIDALMRKLDLIRKSLKVKAAHHRQTQTDENPSSPGESQEA